MPAWVNTPRSDGSARRSDTTICIDPVSSTAVRPIRTRTPVAIGPVTVNSPSVMRVTFAVIVSGVPLRCSCGMSMRPPRSIVTLATVPADTMRATAVGSQIGPTGTGRGGGKGRVPPQELAPAVVHVLGHHRAVQREERGIAAAANAADDRVTHVLVRAALDVTGGMGVGGE